MRNLTVKRNKSFVGCAAKVHVYIEDAVSAELEIEGTPCRKLGTLKNGEEKTFAVTGEQAKVFVIADKLSKNYCNDSYTVPAGQEDVSLSGQCRFSLGSNAFVFDGNENDPEKQRSRKKKSTVAVVIVAVAALIGALVGGISTSAILGAKSNDPKTFSCEGLQITLTKAFSEMKDAAGFTMGYASKDAVVLGLKESFSLMEGLENYTLQEYGQLVLQANGMTDRSLLEKDGITYFTYDYDNTEVNEQYRYVSCLYKGTDAFWLVQFAVETEDYPEYEDDIFRWAESVSFDAA